MKGKSLALSVAVCAMLASPTNAEAIEEPKAKPFPEVTFDRVSDLFGDNLDTRDSRLKTLLLAIGMDHTTADSPHKAEQVGIPYIVHFGPHHWVNRLADGETSIDVLVNNALILLFADAEIPGREKAAGDLMQAAAEAGYWPADFFVAETNLLTHLVRNPENPAPLSNVIDQSHLQPMAQETMAAYNRCAAIGFAPCRYRIGFWLSGSAPSLKNGLTVLQSAVDTTLRDTRYEGVLNAELMTAAAALAQKGDLIGLDRNVRHQYEKLLSKYAKALP